MLGATALLLLRARRRLSPANFPARLFAWEAHLPRARDPEEANCGPDPSKGNDGGRGRWVTLPPFAPAVNATALGRAIAARSSPAGGETTALKWVLRCCPDLPTSLVQKLFRLRQVRREASDLGDQAQGQRLKRVAAKDSMSIGDRIFLPISVKESPPPRGECSYYEEEMNFIRSLVFYKDPAVLVLNKPPGLAVQGGIGVKRSLDEIAAACLSYEYQEPPRLVHRLDQDSSGVLVMGRTQTSAAVLHCIFREKTFAAVDDDFDKKGILRRKYWALVIGCPRRPNGLISAPLGKVVLDDGKSDRIMVVEKVQNATSYHAVTKYKVIDLHEGYSWLELTPLTGRKHQLRVHCAEVLGTPIVGDRKYGWQSHRKRRHVSDIGLDKNLPEKIHNRKTLPFDIDLDSGSISEKHPRLHLHSKQMVLPNVSQALEGVQMQEDYDFSSLDSIDLDAPMPPYMQRSWDILKKERPLA